MKKIVILPLLAFVCIINKSFAQPLYKVSIDEKVNRSSLILEGKVVNQQCFWNARHTMIFTSNKVEVYKTFKGSLLEDTVEIMTQGGTVGMDYIGTSDLLNLEMGKTGIFFCYPNSISLHSPNSKRNLYDVYSSSQGFYLYDHKNISASAPFVHYNDIEKDLYSELQKKTKSSYRTINARFSVSNRANLKVMVGPTITSFSPATVNAGSVQDNTNNLLTIIGTGFGSSPSGSAAVIFDNADDGLGGATISVPYNDPLIVSWTNTQIQLHVPTKAGTGNLQVSDASANVVTASSTLNVTYSVLDASFNISGTNVTKETNLMNTNGSGGYTILYSTNTAGSGINITTDPAQATFKRALTTWKEVAGYNVTEGGNTTIQAVTSDGSNVIMYDNQNTGTAPLASGVLAVCYFYASMCGNTSLSAQRIGFDIVIRNAAVSSGTANFAMGPCPPNSSDYTQVDLETTILHELGHSIGLGHVNYNYTGSTIGQINPGELMNYALVNSVRRTSPDYSAYTGALYQITAQGNTYGSCGLYSGEMTPLATTVESKDNCPVSFPTSAVASGTAINFDLVHATSNFNSDPAYTQVRCDGSGTPVTNNAYYAFMTSSSGGSLNISISNYNLTPSTLSSCATFYAGVPTTGIRFALYQVNSCPSGQTFPTPVSCNTFSANGSLSAITGLTANSKYLIYVDGIENTKASFTMTLSGTVVLPLNLTDFHGIVFNDYNEIFWKADQMINVKKIIIQKSQDGINFQNMGEINSFSQMLNGYFSDVNPFIKTFYRLSVLNIDGHNDYSKIISLQREDKEWVTIFPNPASDFLQLQVNHSDNSNIYKINLYNEIGQLVKSEEIAAGTQIKSISIKELTKGIYQACIYKNGSKIEVHKIFVR